MYILAERMSENSIQQMQELKFELGNCREGTAR